MKKPADFKAILADLIEHHEAEAGALSGYVFVSLHGDGAYMLSYAQHDSADSEGNALIDDLCDLLNDDLSETAH
jgi:hypothetical protein